MSEERSQPDPIKAVYSRSKKVPEFFGFQRNSGVFSLNDSGEPISRSLAWPEEPATVKADTEQVSLPFTAAGISGPLMLPVGLTIVSGSTGAGKSSFVRALKVAMAADVDVNRLLAVEPHDDGGEVADVPTYSSADTALVAAIRGHYAKGRTRPVLFVIDSLRAPLFETSGAAGAKGISMPFFAQVTRVSNCLAKAGLSVIATVNPMDDSPDYVQSFLAKLSASVPAMIVLSDLNRSGGSERYSGTIQMRPRRDNNPFVFDTAAKHAPTVVVELSFDSAPTGVASSSMLRVIDNLMTSPV